MQENNKRWDFVITYVITLNYYAFDIFNSYETK